MTSEPSGPNRSDETLDGNPVEDDAGLPTMADYVPPAEPEPAPEREPEGADATGIFLTSDSPTLGSAPPPRDPYDKSAFLQPLGRDASAFLQPLGTHDEVADDEIPGTIDDSAFVQPAAPKDESAYLRPLGTNDQSAFLQPLGTNDQSAYLQPLGTNDSTGIVIPSSASEPLHSQATIADTGVATGVFDSAAFLAAGPHTIADRRPSLAGGAETIEGYSPDQSSNLAATQQFGATGVFVLPRSQDPESTVEIDSPAKMLKTIPDTGGDSRRSSQPPRPVDNSPRCGKYLLKRFHAKGGMGEIWMAEDPLIGRSVALKRMLGRRPDQIRRFEVEAQVTGQLEHPGIVPVHELGFNDEGHPFYVMKFVQGRTLQKVIEEFHAGKKNGSLKDTEEVESLRLLQIFLSLCQTVAYAHSRGVLHRDLKPENVMLGPYGETILLDWGIAKVKGAPDDAADEELVASYVRLQDFDPDSGTMAGAIMGTPSYMAPEVAGGKTDQIDERSDVYLLGATLYEMLTNKQPRKGKTALEIVKIAKTETPTPAIKIIPSLPKALDAICRKAMAHSQDDRYPSAIAMAEDIQRFVAGDPVSAFPEGFPARAYRWAKKNRKPLTRSAVAVLAITATLVAHSKYRDSERRRVAAEAAAAVAKEKDEARVDLKNYYRLADDTRYVAATTAPAVGQHAPFFDPLQVVGMALASVDAIKRWGPTYDRLPLSEERARLKADVYDLLVLTAQFQLLTMAKVEGSKAARETLERATPLESPTRGHYRLVALADERLGQQKEAADARKKSEDPALKVSALDYFLMGEESRRRSAFNLEKPGGRKSWESDPKELADAIKQYHEVLRIDPDDFWARFQIGRCYLALGRYSEAAEAIGGCIAVRPEAPWAYSVRGVIFAQQQKYADALKDLNHAIELDPNFRPARLNRGAVYQMQDNYSAALADFAEVLSGPKEKQLVQAALYRAQVYQFQGKDREALEDIDRVIAELPSLTEAYLRRALIQLKLGKKEKAAEDLDTYVALALGRKPERWEVHAMRGRVLRRVHAELPIPHQTDLWGQLLANRAVQEMLFAVKLGGQNEELFDDLGAMLEHSGKSKDAIDAYTLGLKLAPHHVKLLLKRAWAYEMIGDHQKSLNDFKEAVGAEPTDAEAHSGVGFEQAVLKSGTDARHEAELALVHGSDKYMVLHNVACIFTVLSQASERDAVADQDVAVALLGKAVKLWRSGQPGPSEIDLIKGDPTFQPLRGRKDFQDLLKDEPKKTEQQRAGDPASPNEFGPIKG